ncbi:MAG: polysaccharide biosynthesis/export family protein [Bacteroidales bacterium]
MRSNNSGLTGAWWWAMALVFTISSCVPIKRQVYLQHGESEAKQEYRVSQDNLYRLKPGNNLHIKVFGIDSDVNDYFNLGYGAASNYYHDAAVYLNSYSVDDSGKVELPFIGNISVTGLTLKEAKEKIQREIDQYLLNTIVIVRLVNYNVTVVGEVARPGQYKIYQDQVSIFEVLGMAGDLTTYANRDEVVLVRKTEYGSKMHRINLLEHNMLESEFYYLMPDDMVYISPVRGKNFAFQTFPYALVISSISLIIGLFALFN